jgi:hypothetical protein
VVPDLSLDHQSMLRIALNGNPTLYGTRTTTGGRVLTSRSIEPCLFTYTNKKNYPIRGSVNLHKQKNISHTRLPSFVRQKFCTRGLIVYLHTEPHILQMLQIPLIMFRTTDRTPPKKIIVWNIV